MSQQEEVGTSAQLQTHLRLPRAEEKGTRGKMCPSLSSDNMML